MSISRNVVILGKVGSGKRTLGNNIVGGNIFGRETALGTGNVGAHYGELRREGTLYRVLTVDTESLQTGYNNPIPYIQQRFQEIHSIIFVIPHGRYTDESHGSLMHAVESLHQQAKSVSALVITHCEGMTDEQRGAIIAEFRDNARSSRVVAFMKHGTYAVGFPDFSTLPPLVKPILQNAVDRDQKAIRKVVERCESPLSVCDLPGVGIQQPYSRSSVSAALQRQAKYKKPYSGALPKYKQQRTVTEPVHPLRNLGPTVPMPKTPVTAGLGISQPKVPVNVGLEASPYHQQQGTECELLIDLGPTEATPVNEGLRVSQGLEASPYYQQQGTECEPLIDLGPTEATPVNEGLRVSQPETPMNVGLGVSRPKTSSRSTALPNTPERQLENLRTVIILGKVGSGKKTLGDRLVGQNIFGHRSGLSGTANMTRNVGASYAEFLEGDPAYRILTVDTESLQTSYNNPISYIMNNFQAINSIIFVIPHGRYTDESHGSLVHAVHNLHPRASLISALVITHCEGLPEQERLDNIAEFRADKSCASIAAFMHKGIYAVGFPDTNTMLPLVRSIMEGQIANDAETIKTLARECDIPLPVEDLTAGVAQKRYSRPLGTSSLQQNQMCSLN